MRYYTFVLAAMIALTSAAPTPNAGAAVGCIPNVEGVLDKRCVGFIAVSYD